MIVKDFEINEVILSSAPIEAASTEVEVSLPTGTTPLRQAINARRISNCEPLTTESEPERMDAFVGTVLTIPQKRDHSQLLKASNITRRMSSGTLAMVTIIIGVGLELGLELGVGVGEELT
jgi:hypothetical protein